MKFLNPAPTRLAALLILSNNFLFTPLHVFFPKKLPIAINKLLNLPSPTTTNRTATTASTASIDSASSS